jgi:hypothetical protein
MHSSLQLTIAIHVDVLLSIAASILFFRPNLRKHYPWIFSYLCVRAVTAVIVEFLRFGPLLASPLTYTKMYFIVEWSSYLISAILLFLSCLDVYRQAMAPLPGLVRMGTTVFRWVAIASLLVTATTLTSITFGPQALVQIGLQMMRCVGTAELCLLAFLVLSMKAIGLSPRSRPFGMALGLGMMAAADSIESTMAAMHLTMSPAMQIIFECTSVLTLGLWIAYSALPEPARKPITVAVNSAIYKWDQIATALGHRGTQVALPPTAPSFFLVDVEKVVERAFVRTLKGKESES